MSKSWQDVQLGDLIDIKHGFAFKGSFFNNDPQGDILLTPGNFAIGGGFKGDKLKYYDGPVPEEFVLQEGDLLVAMTDLSKQSDTLGYPALVPDSSDGRRYLHNQRLGKIVSNDNIETDLRYIYYLMCSRAYRNEVLASATGTTVKHTSPDRIKQFQFSLPPISEQRAIAHILGTLDDKIELNRRMNQTLEEMARALFKSWFVDFDPVRAKAALKQHAESAARTSGNGTAPVGEWTVERARAYLDAVEPQILDLFPERLVPSELGEVPAGWEVKELGQLIELAYGKALRASDRVHGRIPVYGSGGQVGWHNERLVAGPGIVIGRKGNPGSVTWASTDFFPIDTTFYIVPKREAADLHFLYFALAAQNLASISADSAVPGLNRHLAYMSTQVVPDRALRRTFQTLATPILNFRHHIQSQSRSIASQRHTLLSPLISGTIAIQASDQRGLSWL